MSDQYKNLMSDMIILLEVSNKKFKLKSTIKGVSYDEETPLKIPSGDYVVVDTDVRDDSRYIISNKKTLELYAVPKKMVNN